MAGPDQAIHPFGVYPERRADADGRYPPRSGPGLLRRLGQASGPLGREAAVLLRRMNDDTRRPHRPDGLPERVAAIARGLRSKPLSIEPIADGFSLIRDLAEAHLGFRAHDEQVAGAWHMLCGKLIEMDTGEGKTVTAVFTAAVQALSGRSVHLFTVNDYLASRDASDMGPIYNALGLTVACVRQGMSDEDRLAAYRASIVYVTPKQLMFDYLRDRIRLGSAASSPLRTEIAVMKGGGVAGGPGFYLNGLQAAIVDEADSVLIDEAVVPLVISRQELDQEQGHVASQAIAVAGQLKTGEDFTISARGRDLHLTDGGKRRLELLVRPVGGIFSGRLWREQYCEQALTALHLFQRDRDYIVRDGVIEIVDINTGRTMPDRSWERGLHQMIQAKESLGITAPNESVARISHQAFFQRYLNLCGMSGTVKEVAREIRNVYGMPTVRIPAHRPVQRRCFGVAITTSVEAKDRRVVDRVGTLHAAGRAVLVGVRTVACSERLSARLAEKGIPHLVLNARHDGVEADIIAAAGMEGAVTIATNMAGRGTDIRLAPVVRKRGGLHVIGTERHASRRIDRQLFGRAARQGDPGSYEEILCLDDDIVARNASPLAVRLAVLLLLRRPLMALAQSRASRANAELRRSLSRYETHIEQALAFAR